jgi:hypothetical protein
VCAPLWSLPSAPRQVFRTRAGQIGARVKDGTQRANEAQQQVGHRAMMHDGGAARPGTLAIDVSVGKVRGG